MVGFLRVVQGFFEGFSRAFRGLFDGGYGEVMVKGSGGRVEVRCCGLVVIFR